MKNYYEILGVPENASNEEIIKIGRKKVQEYSVEHLFAGKRLGIDYTDAEWKRANAKYAEVIEAYQILKDETKRAEFNRRLNDMRRQRAQQQAQARARASQNFYSGQGQHTQYGQSQRTQSGYSHQGYTSERTRDYYRQGQSYTGQHEQRTRTSQTTGSTTQRNPRSGRTTRTDNTMQRGQKRPRKQKGTFGKMIDSFKEVRQEEKEYPLFERHQDLNRRVRKEFHQNVKSVPGEIVYQMANGTIHITYEFIHQLKKLGYLTEDSVPKYVFRNRKLAAAALAVALMASMPGGGEDIQAFPTPEITIEQTQEQTDQTPIEETIGIVYEEPTVTMNQYYEVVQGDTLSRISTRTGVKVYEIQELNGRVGTDKIYIGETLILPYTIDREDLQYYTITVPAKGISVNELAKKYRTDAATIMDLNKEAIAYVNTGYVILTDTAVVPNFITVEEFDMMQQAASGHNY